MLYCTPVLFENGRLVRVDLEENCSGILTLVTSLLGRSLVQDQACSIVDLVVFLGLFGENPLLP